MPGSVNNFRLFSSVSKTVFNRRRAATVATVATVLHFVGVLSSRGLTSAM